MIGAVFALVLFTAMGVLADSSPSGDVASVEPDISYAEGRISADLHQVPLDEVIAALTRETGVEFHGELLEPREVTVCFEGIRFRDAVDRLVGDQNFTITYDATGRPRRVKLWGMRRRAAPPRNRPPASGRGFASLMVQHPPVNVPPVLANALGAPTMRLTWVLRSGLRHKDPAVRTAATAFFLQMLNGEPRLRAALMQTDDQTLSTLLRTWAGTGAERIVGTLAAEAWDPLLRSKARRVLDRLKPAQPRATPRA